MATNSVASNRLAIARQNERQFAHRVITQLRKVARLLVTAETRNDHLVAEANRKSLLKSLGIARRRHSALIEASRPALRRAG